MKIASTKFLAVIFLFTLAATPLRAQTPIDMPGMHPPSQNEVVMKMLSELDDIVPVLGVFGMSVAIVAIFFNFLHRRNKMLHETLRAMIEKGVPIPPELITKSGGNSSNQPQKSLNDLRAGLILAGMGIGLTMLAGKVGFILLFMGVALLIVWMVERKNKNDSQLPKP